MFVRSELFRALLTSERNFSSYVKIVLYQLNQRFSLIGLLLLLLMFYLTIENIVERRFQ